MGTGGAGVWQLAGDASQRWKTRDKEGRGGASETWKEKKQGQGGEEEREYRVVRSGESRLAKKRGEWYENICDGFKGKNAR